MQSLPIEGGSLKSYIGVKDGLLTTGENVTNIVLWDLVVEHNKNYLKKEKTL